MKLHKLFNDCHSLHLAHDVIVYFSYQTPVALRSPGVGTVVDQSCADAASKTTRKHLRELSLANCVHVPNERFTQLLDMATLASTCTNYTDAARLMLDAWNDEASPRLGG